MIKLILAYISIVAASSAFAYPRSSLIASHEISRIEVFHNYDASSYVHDGLIVHFDGIESSRSVNTNRQHNIWHSLKGDFTAEFDEYSFWTEYGICGDGLTLMQVPGLQQMYDDGNMIIECLARQTSDDDCNLAGFSAAGMFILLIRPSISRIYVVWSNHYISEPRVCVGGRDAFLFTIVFKGNGLIVCYINGHLAYEGSAGDPPTNDGLYIGRSYRQYKSNWEKMEYRVYSRQLTEQEIMFNFSVDRERFNLR